MTLLFSKDIRQQLQEAFKKEMTHDERVLTVIKQEYFDNKEPTENELKAFLEANPTFGIYYLIHDREYKNSLFLDCVFSMVFKMDDALNLWVRQIYSDMVDAKTESGNNASKIQEDVNTLRGNLIPDIKKILEAIDYSKKKWAENGEDMIV